jgi:hypothetical protein
MNLKSELSVFDERVEAKSLLFNHHAHFQPICRNLDPAIAIGSQEAWRRI